MAKITAEEVRDERFQKIVTVKKSRGKLTVKEIIDYLTNNEDFNGNYVLLLNCLENNKEIGWGEDEPEGDAVILYMMEEYTNCPVCNKLLPPFEYCPVCSAKWRDYM